MKNPHRLFDIESLSCIDKTNTIYHVLVPSCKNIIVDNMLLTDVVVTQEDLEEMVFGRRWGMVQDKVCWVNFFNNAASDNIIRQVGEICDFAAFDLGGKTLYRQSRSFDIYWGSLPQLLEGDKFYLPKSIAQYLFDNILTSYNGFAMESIELFMNEYKQNLILEANYKFPIVPYDSISGGGVNRFEKYQIFNYGGDGKYSHLDGDYKSKNWILNAVTYIRFLLGCQNTFDEPIYEFTGSIDSVYDIMISTNNNSIISNLSNTILKCF